MGNETDFTVDRNGVITGYTGSGGDVVIPASIGGIAVRAIADRAFMGKGLTSIVIPACAKEIGEMAFGDNQIEKAVIPGNITVGRYAFSGTTGENPITEITIGENVTHLSPRNGRNFPSFYDAKKQKAGTYVFDMDNKKWREKETAT